MSYCNNKFLHAVLTHSLKFPFVTISHPTDAGFFLDTQMLFNGMETTTYLLIFLAFVLPLRLIAVYWVVGPNKAIGKKPRHYC